MHPLLRGLAALLLLATLAGTARAQAPAEPPAPGISLLTFAPGATYWQRFGHNALLIENTAGGTNAMKIVTVGMLG